MTWTLRGLAIALSIVISFGSLPAASALTDADLNAIYTGSEWYDPDSTCFFNPVATNLNKALPGSIPEPFKTIFTQAAEAHGADVIALAAVMQWEIRGRGFDNPPPPYGTGDPYPINSTSGAMGPFQFMPTTWYASYSGPAPSSDGFAGYVRNVENWNGVVGGGVHQDGNNDGFHDPFDLVDAAHGAAVKLARDGATTNALLGSLDPLNPYNDNDVRDTITEAFIGYNWGAANVDNKRLPLPAETAAYLDGAGDIYKSLSGQSGLPDINDACGAAGGVSIVGDFAFPLRTTKSVVLAGSTWDDGRVSVWCYRNTSNCHHSYNAADIFVETGTPVVAAVGGTVRVSCFTDCAPYGARVSITDASGLNYYYAHNLEGSVVVSTGDVITAGTELAQVGTNADAQGTARHLHFDVIQGGRPACSSGVCAQYPFVNVQQYLVPSFNGLPE